jgi:hypothetical protein
MGQNAEHIEAKLAMYVDGALDEAGKAEIEKHLAANPQHRRLLEELMLTRSWVRQLPRASMPPELSESLQSQLERSVLLDERTNTEAVARINRWPQYVAAAAILLLAVGLVSVVYFVVAPTGKPQELAVREITPAEDGAASAPLGVVGEPLAMGNAGGGAGEAEQAPRRASESATPEAAVRARDDSAIAKAGAEPAAPKAIELARESKQKIEDAESLADDAPRKIAPPPDARSSAPFVVLISAAIANAQIVEFLDANRIEWEPLADDGTPLPADLPPEPEAAPPQPGQDSPEAPEAPMPATTRASEPATQMAEMMAEEQRDASGLGGLGGRAMQELPEQKLAEQAQAEPPDPVLRRQAAFRARLLKQPERQVTSNFIVARKITRKQTAEILRQLERPQFNQRALLVEQRMLGDDGENRLIVVPAPAVTAEMPDPATQPSTLPATQPSTQPATLPAEVDADADARDSEAKADAKAEPVFPPSPATQPSDALAEARENEPVLKPIPAGFEEKIDVLIVVQPVLTADTAAPDAPAPADSDAADAPDAPATAPAETPATAPSTAPTTNPAP